MRFFLDISYRGTSFHGWQVQNNAKTVQGDINEALSTILRSPVECVGSGRTDTGVHATGQIAHFDWDEELNPEDFTYKLNSFLPDTIAIQSCRRVKPEAHARFDATLRAYEYHLHHHKDPFREGVSYHFNTPVEVGLIQEGCEILRSWQNFQAFSKVQTDVSTFNCEINEMRWEQANDRSVFHVSANRFLRGMVRALVGTLLDVGQKRTSLDELRQILKSGDRRKAGRAAPAQGLFLTRVCYPDHIFI